MLLHPYSIPQDRAPSVWAAGIHGDDSYSQSVFAIVTRQLIDQRAFARARRTGKAENASLAAIGEDCFQHLRPAVTVVFYQANSARQSTRIPGAEMLH